MTWLAHTARYDQVRRIVPGSPMIFAVATVSSFALVSAVWGYGSSWLAEVIKQDGWPKPLNTVISDLLLVGSAALATLTDSTFTLHNVGAAVLFAALAAMANRQLFLEPTGVGPALKSATSVLKPAAPPAGPTGSVADYVAGLIERARAYGAKQSAVLQAIDRLSEALAETAVTSSGGAELPIAPRETPDVVAGEAPDGPAVPAAEPTPDPAAPES